VLGRNWPLALLGVATVALGFSIASKIVPLPLAVLVMLAAYFVGLRLLRPVSIRAVVVAAVAIGGALGYAGLARKGAPVAGMAIQSLVPLVAAWFVGDAVAVRRRYQEGLAEQAERDQAAETERARQEIRDQRVRIAQDLHDVVAHTLAVITVQAGVGRRLMAKRPEEASNALESIEAIGRTAQEELRVVLGLLREEGVSTPPLTPAPRLVDLKELAETVRSPGSEVELRMSGVDRRLSPALELSLYRVVQEALTNVMKHAPGAAVTVELAVSDNLVRVEILDDGGPREARTTTQPAGHGIVGMRERVGAFGGSLVASPRPGRGFKVVAEVPIEEGVT
jgi:signal transduction histidine kinase